MTQLVPWLVVLGAAWLLLDCYYRRESDYACPVCSSRKQGEHTKGCPWG